MKVRTWPRRRKITAALVATLVLALTFASSAFGSTASEAGTAQDLTFLEQQVVNVRETTVSSRTFKRGMSNCYVEVHKTTGENAFNVDLWWVKQRVAWCGKKITQVTHPAWVIASGPWYTAKCKGRSYGITAAGFWWEWLGWRACRAKGSVGDSKLYRYGRGKFRYCPVSTGCIQYKEPFAWVRAWANGDKEEGGGIN
jgi:hypothetical protein